VSNWDAHCHQYGVDVGAIALGGNICGGFSDITLNGFFWSEIGKLTLACSRAIPPELT